MINPMTSPQDQRLALSVIEVRDLIKAGKATSTEITRLCLARIEECKGLNALNTVCADYALAAAADIDARAARGDTRGLLFGVPVVIKDNLCTIGIRTTASSQILENFVPAYDAEVVTRLKKEGAVIVGKANMDEFAMGSSNETSYFGVVHNPHDPDRVPGGSSGGSAAAVASFQCYAALGTDTGGSIRQPAAFCGVYGLKPAYGRVSRYGGIAMASSLDQFGPVTRNIDDLALVYAVIAGKDEKDMTSLAGGYTYARPNGALPAGFKVAYPQEYLAHIKHEGVRAACDDAAARLTAAGAAVKSVSMPLLGYAIPTYYILMCAEATSNLARYDGVKYGKRHPDAKDLVEVYEKSRTAYLGNEVKRRLMLGNYALSSGYFDAYYMKAQRVRTLIRQEILAVLQEFDVILTPTAPTPAPVFNAESDPLEVYLSDIFTVPANLSGCAALNVPYREREKLPVGVQLMAAPAAEQTLFDAAAAIVNQRGVRV